MVEDKVLEAVVDWKLCIDKVVDAVNKFGR